MKSPFTRAAILIGPGMALLFGGCATTLAPARYAVSPSRPYRPVTLRTIYVCPSFDRLDVPNRAELDPSFNPSAYLTDALEQELAAAGLRSQRTSFAFAPDFSGLSKALKNGSLPNRNAVVLSSAINHFSRNRELSCDFKVYSSDGRLLFEKRGLFIGASLLNQPDVGDGPLEAPRMVMQQLFADPEFQKALL